MKIKTPRGIWALRAVTITIALLVVVVFGAFGYSAYKDYVGVRSELLGGGQGTSGRAVLQGTSEVVSMNITVPNSGLFALNVTVICDSQNTNVVCQPSHIEVPAGQQEVLHFQMTVVNVGQFWTSANHRINGTLAIAMEPFARLTLGVDLGGFVQKPPGVA